MRHVQIDMAHLRIKLVDVYDHLRRLNEMHRLAAVVDVEARNARRPAPLPGDERNLAGEHLFIGLSHPLYDPGLQYRIGEVRHPVSRLALALAHLRAPLVAHTAAQSAP